MQTTEQNLSDEAIHTVIQPSSAFEAQIEGVSIEVLSATVFGPARLSADSEDGGRQVAVVTYRVDRGPWEPLRHQDGVWVTELPTQQLVEGPHTIEVKGVRTDGVQKTAAGTFRIARRVP